MKTTDKIESIKKWLGTGTVNIFGIQFSGKDTVGNRLAECLGAITISSGDVMRRTFVGHREAIDDDIKKASEVGSLTGSLMPTNAFQRMMVHRLAEPDLQGKPLILSSVGRWIGEEQPIMASLTAAQHGTKAVILLRIEESTAWKRWKTASDPRDGGRHDDMEEAVVARRINEYKTKTVPVLEVYRDMGLLLEVNGEQVPEKVFSDVIDALYDFSRASASP